MTRWTWKQYEDLSRRVAVKFGIKPPTFDFEGSVGQIDSDTYPVWIYNDWNTIMELCVKHGVNATSYHWYQYSRAQIGLSDAPGHVVVVETKDHNNDISLTERVARCLALLEVTL